MAPSPIQIWALFPLATAVWFGRLYVRVSYALAPFVRSRNFWQVIQLSLGNPTILNEAVENRSGESYHGLLSGSATLSQSPGILGAAPVAGFVIHMSGGHYGAMFWVSTASAQANGERIGIPFHKGDTLKPKPHHTVLFDMEVNPPRRSRANTANKPLPPSNLPVKKAA